MRHVLLLGNPLEVLEKTNESRLFTVSVLYIYIIIIFNLYIPTLYNYRLYPTPFKYSQYSHSQQP